MLYYIILYYIILYYIILYYFILYHIILYYIILYYIILYLYYIILYLYYIILYYVISYYIILYHIISYYIIWYHIISYYTTLFNNININKDIKINIIVNININITNCHYISGYDIYDVYIYIYINALYMDVYIWSRPAPGNPPRGWLAMLASCHLCTTQQDTSMQCSLLPFLYAHTIYLQRITANQVPL